MGMQCITIKLPEGVARQLREEARQSGRSIAALIRERIEAPPRDRGSVYTVTADLAGSNDEAFALLNRRDASRMVEAASNARRMVDLVTAISTYSLFHAQIPIGHAFEWLNAFDIDEIRTLLAEVHSAFRRAADAEISWDGFEAVLHEWHESAIAIRSDALAAAFSAPGEEVPLTQPAWTGDGCRTDV